MGYCPYCKYKWLNKTNNPKACPRCKSRLDYYPVRQARQEQRKEES